jgi:hypothetical protein
VGRRKNGYIEELKVAVVCNDHFVFKPFFMLMTFKTSQMMFNNQEKCVVRCG